MFTYSFLDNGAAIIGPGGSINIGAGAGIAEEGITWEPTGDANTMTIGADGQGMHSLSADRSGTLTVRVLQTSPTNAKLQAMFNLQQSSAALWGQNAITVRNAVRGDLLSCINCAFSKNPAFSAAKDGTMVEWTFHAIQTVKVLGVGTPEV